MGLHKEGGKEESILNDEECKKFLGSSVQNLLLDKVIKREID